MIHYLSNRRINLPPVVETVNQRPAFARLMRFDRPAATLHRQTVSLASDDPSASTPRNPLRTITSHTRQSPRPQQSARHEMRLLTIARNARI
jgi:hypothetical protein